MRSAFFAVALTACSEPKNIAAQGSAVDTQHPFYVDCGKPLSRGNWLPEGVNEGFRLEVDLRGKTYTAPWSVKPLSVKAYTQKLITFADYKTQNGPDGNPASEFMQLDVSTGKLTYLSDSAGYIPMSGHFTADCEIISNA